MNFIKEAQNNKNIKKVDETIDILYKNLNNITKLSKAIIRDTNNADGDDNDDIEYHSLKNLLYELLEEKKHHSVEGKIEFKTHGLKEKFNILIGDTPVKLKLFVLFIILFYTESKINKKRSFVGIDYEFNNRQIALMQTCFFMNPNNIVWIINPAELDKNQLQVLIDFLMIRSSIHKILHGCDSLDIPYMYQQMLSNNEKYIRKLTSKIIDTRFLCEYYRIIKEDGKKCSIYDALLYFEIISEEKYKELNEISDMAGPIQDISWNVHKLSSFNIKYAYYDVIFLKEFLFGIFRYAKNKVPQNYYSFKYIYVITRFVLQERHENAHIVNDMKKNVDPINNYMIKHHGNNITLVNIFTQIIDELFIKEIGCNIKDILNINFLKTPLMIILKAIIYYVMVINHVTYINKNDIYKIDFQINKLYGDLEHEGHYKFIEFLQLFQKTSEEKITLLYE